MSLYLQFAVGAGLYLCDAAYILAIDDDPPSLDKNPLPVVDRRELFAQGAAAPATSILFAQVAGGVALPAVDRVGGLVEPGDAEFCPLPPIGPPGMLIDAVSTRLVEGRPLLRVRAERSLAAAAASA